MTEISIGEIIRQKLDESGIPYAEFAKRIHCERQSLYYLFKCKSIDIDRLILISKALDYDFIKHIYLNKNTEENHTNENIFVIDIDAEKIKSAPPPARSAFPASPARLMGRF